MKTLIIATLLASVAAAPAALAADMPVKAAPRIIAPVNDDWNGFYLFGFGGYSWGKITPEPFDLSEIDGLHNPKPKGGVFGFGGGYLWQYSRWVGGLEVDYGFSDEKDDQTVCIKYCKERGINLNINSKIDALGSARIRAGYLLTANLLAYGTAGVAWGRSNVSVSLSNGQQSEELLSAKTNLFGWVAGGGAEYKLFEHLRIRGEYLHYDFGSTTYAFQTPLILGVNINAKTTDDVVRGALIWSFN